MAIRPRPAGTSSRPLRVCTTATDVSPWITKWQRAINVPASIRFKVAAPICKRTAGPACWMAIWCCVRVEQTTLRQAVDRDVRQSEEEMRPMLMGHSPICFGGPCDSPSSERNCARSRCAASNFSTSVGRHHDELNKACRRRVHREEVVHHTDE